MHNIMITYVINNVTVTYLINNITTSIPSAIYMVVTGTNLNIATTTTQRAS